MNISIEEGDEVVGVIGPEYYRSYNAYRFSGKEQVRGLYDFGARWFTPKIAHWTTMDPLAEKYFSISPYAYCAGNPVNLVDPEGSFLFVGQYQYSDGSLYDSKMNIVNREDMDYFTRDVYDALVSIGSTSSGQEVISTLQYANYEYTILQAEASEFKRDNTPCAFYYEQTEQVQSLLDQIGSGGTIYWNESGAKLQTTEGVKENSTSDLMHKMSHAFDAFFGRLDDRKEKGIKRSEWQAVYRENLFRSEMGLPLRTKYLKEVNPSGVFCGFTGPNMVKKNKLVKPFWYSL